MDLIADVHAALATDEPFEADVGVKHVVAQAFFGSVLFNFKADFRVETHVEVVAHQDFVI